MRSVQLGTAPPRMGWYSPSMTPDRANPTVVTKAHRTPDAGPEASDHLRELVAALDARVPRLERAGEGAIARDAAALRHEALKRIAALERADSRE